jgi:type I restriction enzyme S subunit
VNAESFLQNFEAIAGAPGGITRIRDLVHYFAITGGLSRQQNGDSDASLILEDSLNEKERYLEQNSIRQIPRKHIEIFQIVKRLPSHWVTISAGDLVHLINGKAFKTSEWQPAGLPIIRIQNLNDRNAPFNYFQGDLSKSHRVQTGDMLLSWSGTPGTSFGAFIWSAGEAVLNQHIFKVLIYSSMIHKEYLRMAFNACLDALIGSARGGAGLKHVTKGQIESLQVPLPPLEEQKRIVQKVDELTRLCDRLKAEQRQMLRLFPILSRSSHARFLTSTNLANLRAIFHTPGSASTGDLCSTILTLGISGKLVPQDLTDGLAVSYLREKSKLPAAHLSRLPKTWTWARVDEVGEVQLGRQRAPEYHKGPNMRPYLRVQNVYEARLDLSDVKSMEFGPRDFNTFRLQTGDILLNEGQSRELVGRPALYAGEIEDACFQNTLIRFRHRSFVLPEYALIVFRAYMHSGRFQEISKQTTNIAHLGAGRFASLEFPLPPIAEQARIVAKVTSLLESLELLEKQQVAAKTVLDNFAKAIVAAITATKSSKVEMMRAPKTEVVTVLKVNDALEQRDPKSLAELLSQHRGRSSAKALWQLSGLEIDSFYRQLKMEIEKGWIVEPAKAVVKEVDAS